MRSVFSRRARKKDMLKRERQRLTVKVGQYLASLGGQPEPLPDSWPGPRAIFLETCVGRLRVTCHGNWLACRFEEPDRAKAFLPHGPGQRLNSYSGKWNFHYGRVTADEALAAFRAELEPLLPRQAND